MTILYLLLLAGACLCLGIAAFATTQPRRVNLMALGLLLFVLVSTIQLLVRIAD